MKIALVSFGLTDYCIPLANGLAERASVTYVYGHKGSPVDFSSLSPKVTLQQYAEPRLRQLTSQIKCMLRLARDIRARAPDVVHLQHAHPWFNLIALPLLKRFPVVCTIHDVLPHPGDKLSAKTPFWTQRVGYRQASQVIVHGHSLKALAAARLKISATRINCVPMIANVTVPLTTAQGASQSAKGTKDILFFGRIFEYKGLRYLIEAEPLITARVPEARIVIAGTGDDLEKYQRQMVHPGQFVVHNHFISNQEMSTLFNEAEVVALPYIEASQSGVVPVAYRFGKAVVASRVGGLPDFVDDGQTGLLVPPRDTHALAAALVRLLMDDSLRRQMGHKGRMKMEAECSPRAVAALTLDVYRKAIAAG